MERKIKVYNHARNQLVKLEKIITEIKYKKNLADACA